MAKKKVNVGNSVSIDQTTLCAINNLMFSNNGGTDYSAIIDDLAGDNRELTKLRVGLVANGLYPELADEDKIRYRCYYRASEKSSRIEYYRMELVSISHILDVVTYRRVPVVAPKLDVLDDGTYTYGTFADAENCTSYLETCSINSWLYDYETSQEAIEAECRS